MLLENSMKSLGFQLSIQFQTQQTYSTSYIPMEIPKPTDSPLVF